ncbi:MAG: hypothetical protein JWR21_1808 [Herminiimonas sp.]|nr:hypothetical protein [Herminiimonas sp.]
MVHGCSSGSWDTEFISPSGCTFLLIYALSASGRLNTQPSYFSVSTRLFSALIGYVVWKYLRHMLDPEYPTSLPHDLRPDLNSSGSHAGLWNRIDVFQDSCSHFPEFVCAFVRLNRFAKVFNCLLAIGTISNR